jgi:hypothetical protein
MNVLRTGSIGLLVSLVLGCDTGQLPVDSSLEVSPSERKLVVSSQRTEDGLCVFNPESYIDYPFVARISGPDGSPIGGSSLRIYLSFGENTFSGIPVMALYEDRNGNGVVDADTELASSADDDLATLKTDDVTGQTAFLVRANISCPYQGELFIYGDGVSATATITIEDRTASTGTDAEEGG